MQSEMTPPVDVLVIGAGICGLTAATKLQEAGRSVVVLDKGRGVGGRMATRRIDEATFDHGAQFIRFHNPHLQTEKDQWVEEGLLTPWFSREALDGDVAYRGAMGMTQLPKHLAASLDVRCQQKVTDLRIAGNWWHVTTESGECYQAKTVLCTAPVPQALALLNASQLTPSRHDLDALKAITYDPCLAVMLRLKQPLDWPPTAIENNPTIAWVADNQQKGISTAPALTIHTTPDYARTNLERTPEAIVADCLAAEVLPITEADVLTYQVHRWRYSLVSHAYSGDAYLPLAFESSTLWLAGDGFEAGRVEGAILSGVSVAQAIYSSK